MPEIGDLSSSVHGFLFTVLNKLPNKSLPDLKTKQKKTKKTNTTNKV